MPENNGAKNILSNNPEEEDQRQDISTMSKTKSILKESEFGNL